VVTQSIRVANDLTNCSGLGLEVRASSVTLDLNGHTIDGDGGSTTGVLVAGFDGVTVKGGRLQQLQFGVRFERTRSSRAVGLTVVDSEWGIRFFDSEASAAAGNNLSRMPSAPAIEAFDSRRMTVERNSCTNCLDAVSLFATHDSLVADNKVTGGEGGISLRAASRNRVSRNSLGGDAPGPSGSQGVTLTSGSTDNLVERNSLDREFGVIVFSASDNTIERNTGRGNIIGVRVVDTADRNNVLRNRFSAANTGIQVFEGSDDNVVDGNVLSGSADRGIHVAIETDRTEVVRNVVSDAGFRGIDAGAGAVETRLRDNRVTGSGEDGVYVHVDAPGVVLVDNDSSRNRGDGFEIESATATLTRNRAVNNGGWGIIAPSSATNGGGNRAHGNAAGQCLGIVCTR
jgi:parallel beta-helix repeat protein